MKLTKNGNNGLVFKSFLKEIGLLLCLVGISLNSFGQIYIGKNTKISIGKNTLVHTPIKENNSPQTVKIYIEENVHIINFPKDTLVEIVYIKKQKHQKHKNTTQKKSKQPSQPPMVERDIESENRNNVLSFVSKKNVPFALFYSGKITKAALVQNVNTGTKFFPAKKYYQKITDFFLLNNDVQKLKISLNEFLPARLADVNTHITRPPPFQYS